MRRVVAVVGAAFLILALAAPVAGSSRDHAFRYYLSLGDSLAAGQQPIGDPTDLYRTSDGYTDQLYEIARRHSPNLQHVKLGCPGETTDTMIYGYGPCFDAPSQLATAVAFLQSHTGRVSFITIDIGWNDLDAGTACALAHPELAAWCIAQYFGPVGTNIGIILGALKDAAPGVPIVGMNLYDPFLAFWLQGAEGQYLAGLSVDVIGGVNDFVGGVYDSLNVPVADVETAFHTTAWSPVLPVPGLGDVPLNVATICVYSWKCSPYQDNHATHFGYRAMALAFADVLGL